MPDRPDDTPRPAAPARTVLAGLDGIRSDIEGLYRDLHRHPELGLREHRTAKRRRTPCVRPATRSPRASAARACSASW